MQLPGRLLSPAAAAVLACGVAGQPDTATAPFLNLTAISAANGSSTLECWQFGRLAPSPVQGVQGALSLFLGPTANATYSVIPAHFDGGLHNAPAVQFVLFASGLAHVTLPGGGAEAWVRGGKHGLIVAADTADVSERGHRTEYPSDDETVALVVPVAAGLEHEVLHSGPCTEEEMTGT